jgi:hypothetical protein
VDRLEFTLIDFSRHHTNQPYSLGPDTQLKMRVELFSTRAVPEPAIGTSVAWLLVVSVLTRRRG